jgi:hypothetical protein
LSFLTVSIISKCLLKTKTAFSIEEMKKSSLYIILQYVTGVKNTSVKMVDELSPAGLADGPTPDFCFAQ